MARWPASLRTRLTLWYTAILAAPLVIFAVICYALFAQTLMERTDRFLNEALTVFVREVGAERRIKATARDAVGTTVREMRFRNLWIVVLDTAGNVIAASEAVAMPTADAARVLGAFYGRGAADRPPETIAGADGGQRIVTHPLGIDNAPYVVGGSYPLADVKAVLNRIRLLFVVAIPLLLVAAAAGAYLLANRGLAPVAAMAARAKEISASTLHERLPVAGGEELTDLARVVNDLLDRLAKSFEQQRRFMADASHELRTPTAILRTETEVTLSRTGRSEAEYRESAGVVLDAARRLTRIVDDLFLLARSDAGHLVIRNESVYLEEVVHNATRAMSAVGEGRQVRVELRDVVQAHVQGDPDLLGRLILNLLDNAIKYSPEGGAVGVAMALHGNRCAITVSDQGPGIAATMAEAIFERFYRGDAARVRAADSVTAGAGLGLAISRRIAEVHGGQLELAQSQPGRTEFRFTIPLADAPSG